MHFPNWARAGKFLSGISFKKINGISIILRSIATSAYINYCPHEFLD